MRKRLSATSASDPPKKNGETGRSLLVECETLPLPQLREGGGKTPSQGDVIEAEIPDVSGRAVVKVLLEALEVNPTDTSGIFARVTCMGVVDMELADYAVQVLGMGKDRKEFMIHLCTPQGPGRCEETGAALHIGKWSVVPGEADIGRKKRNDRDRPRAGDCRSWASPFRTDGRRRAGGPSCDSGRRDSGTRGLEDRST